jgi:hypothetical protein
MGTDKGRYQYKLRLHFQEKIKRYRHRKTTT